MLGRLMGKLHLLKRLMGKLLKSLLLPGRLLGMLLGMLKSLHLLMLPQSLHLQKRQLQKLSRRRADGPKRMNPRKNLLGMQKRLHLRKSLHPLQRMHLLIFPQSLHLQKRQLQKLPRRMCLRKRRL